MKLTVCEIPSIAETEITINCQSIDGRLRRLVRQIKQYSYIFQAKAEFGQCMVPAEQVYYIDSVDSKTFLYAEKEIYSSQETLSELEKRLLDSTFIRISKNCILNIEFLRSVQPLWNNRLEASLVNGEKLIVSRRYIRNLKEKIKG